MEFLVFIKRINSNALITDLFHLNCCMCDADLFVSHWYFGVVSDVSFLYAASS